MQAPVVNITAVKAFVAAVERKGTAAGSTLEDWANTAFIHPSDMALTSEKDLPELLTRIQPLTPLQQAHADAKARAAKIASRETGVCSVYDLGEIIADMEDEATVHWGAGDTSTGIALGKFAKHLKALIPALRMPILPKDCPHCGAKAQVGNEGGRIYIQCSNKASCPAWPQTQNKLSLEAATTAWNNDEIR